MEEKKTNSHKKDILISFVIGIIIALIFFLISDIIAGVHIYILVGFLSFVLISLLIVVQVLVKKKKILDKISGVDGDNLKLLQEDSSNLIEHILKKEKEDALASGKATISRLIAWYGWLSFRVWSIRLIFGLIVAVGTIVGAALLVQQNELIKNQNLLIELEQRPFVWGGIPSENQANQPEEQSYKNIVISTLNSPAHVNKITIEYILRNKDVESVVTIDTFNNLILFPNSNEFYSIETATKISKLEALRLPEGQDLERKLSIDYVWLYNNNNPKNYAFEISWVFNKGHQNWDIKRQFGN